MRVLVSSARAFHKIYGIKYDEIKRFRPCGGREPGRALDGTDAQPVAPQRYPGPWRRLYFPPFGGYLVSGGRPARVWVCGGGASGSRTTHLLLLPRSKLTSIPQDEIRPEGDAEQGERRPVRASDLSARFLRRSRRLRLSTLQPRRQDCLLLLQLCLQRLRTQKGFLSVSDGRCVGAARRACTRSGARRQGGDGCSGGRGQRS